MIDYLSFLNAALLFVIIVLSQIQICVEATLKEQTVWKIQYSLTQDVKLDWTRHTLYNKYIAGASRQLTLHKD